MSRVPRRPSVLSQQNLQVALPANATKVLDIGVPAKLPPNSMIAVTLAKAGPDAATASNGCEAGPLPRGVRTSQSGIVALNFSTAAVPMVQTASLK